MADATAIRLLLSGKYPAGPFMGEIWQTGMSFVEMSTGLSPTAIRAPLGSFSVSTIGEVEEDATWSIDWAWKGDTLVTQSTQKSMASLAKTFFDALKPYCTPNLSFNEVRISALGADGKVINGANVFTLKTPVLGTYAGGASQSLPNQLAVVASLRTGARGPAGRGRMFLPLNAGAGAGGVITSSLKTAVNNAVDAFVKGVYAIPGPLASVVNAVPQTYSAIRSVGVGDLYDTQRRRRNAIQENYTVKSIVH